MKTKIELGESVRREIYESVHTSVNFSTNDKPISTLFISVLSLKSDNAVIDVT